MAEFNPSKAGPQSNASQDSEGATERSWGFKGVSQPVIPGLFYRLQMHSPDLYLQLRWYLDENGESPFERVTHDGADASAMLSLQLLEALISFSKLRMEVLDQHQLSPVVGKIPGNLQLAMSEMLRLEPLLLQAATAAMEMHMQVWNAHDEAAPWTPPEDPEDPKAFRGRWVKEPNKKRKKRKYTKRAKPAEDETP